MQLCVVCGGVRGGAVVQLCVVHGGVRGGAAVCTYVLFSSLLCYSRAEWN